MVCVACTIGIWLPLWRGGESTSLIKSIMWSVNFTILTLWIPFHFNRQCICNIKYGTLDLLVVYFLITDQRDCYDVVLGGRESVGPFPQHVWPAAGSGDVMGRETFELIPHQIWPRAGNELSSGQCGAAQGYHSGSADQNAWDYAAEGEWVDPLTLCKIHFKQSVCTEMS